MNNALGPHSHIVTTPDESAISFVCISDTHNAQPAVPTGDVLIHAGDLTQNGTTDELQAAVRWISSLPHPVKIVVAGNHDKVLDPVYRDSELLDEPDIDWDSLGITYLEHASTEITIRGRTLTVFGSPHTPEFGRWAFQYPPAHLIAEPARRVWAAVPLHTDVLITHGPPFGYLDSAGNQHAGCSELLERVRVVKPALHVLGHIHAGRGRETVVWDDERSKRKVLGFLGGILPWTKTARPQVTRAARETVLVNASIQPGQVDGPLNEAHVVYL